MQAASPKRAAAVVESSYGKDLQHIVNHLPNHIVEKLQMYRAKRIGFPELVFTAMTLTAACSANATATSALFDFASGSLSVPGWALGAQSGGNISLSTNLPSILSGQTAESIVGNYPVATGQVYVWGAYDVSSLKTYELYVDFWARMPGAKQGLKFLKVFGGSGGVGVANSTFGMDYTGIDNGAMVQVGFGDGTSTSNDYQNCINFDGTNPSCIGRSYGSAKVSTPQNHIWASSNWGTSWHHFRIHVKFNDGTTAANEVANGAYYVEIDGVVYVNASGLFNRNYQNAPIDRVELFGWAQGGNQAFELDYAHISVSTTGFPASSNAPAAPSNLKVTQ